MNPALMEQVDEYLSGRLSDDDLDEFEIQLLEDPALQAFVKEQIAFRDALGSESPLLLSEPPASILDRIHSFLITPAWAYAASIGLVLLLPMALLPNGGTPQTTATSMVWRNVEAVRGAESLQVSAPANTPIMLSIDGYGMGLQTADILVSLHGENLVSLKAVTADENSLFNIVLSPLPAETYQVELVKPGMDSLAVQLIVE